MSYNGTDTCDDRGDFFDRNFATNNSASISYYPYHIKDPTGVPNIAIYQQDVLQGLRSPKHSCVPSPDGILY